MNFSQRSYKKELLDGDDIPFDDIRRNMEELDFINTHLGGHVITIDGIKKLIASPEKAKTDRWVICEIGCGGGDNLLAIQKWSDKNKLPVAFIGIDINPSCISVASEKLKSCKTQMIISDYKLVNFENNKPDIIFSSLFCHHFTDNQLISMLQWMKSNARIGFFINDLHRHFMAYHSIRILAKLFSSSYLVKNDAPLSVLRGFIKKEWETILNSAGIQKYAINWKWAFRHLIVVHNQDCITRHHP